MSSTLQQAKQYLLAESLKGDSERDDALIKRLDATVQRLQGSAGEAALLPITA